MADSSAVVLKPGREKPVLQGHPWIFSGAVDRLPVAADGEIVDVVDRQGEWLARGFLNRRSQIQVRILSRQRREAVDPDFWAGRIRRAAALRDGLAQETLTTGYRLINGESDYLPGLIVDRYGDFLVLQIGALGLERHKQLLATLLMESGPYRGVLERSDMSARSQEGLAEAVGLVAGEAPAGPVPIQENGLHFEVDLLGGQKTGFYTDQRANRQRVAAYCRGATVLNGFSYTGAFGVYALAAGAAHVVNVDTSYEALVMGERHFCLNGFDPDGCTESLAGDLFQIVRDWRTQRRTFDVVILDPPKFVQQRQNLEAGLRGYKDINRLALHLLRPGGILATFSCSGLVSPELFQKVLFGAALDADRPVQILEWLRQGTDHPVAITFPEGAYLKGLLCRVGE